MLRLVKAERAKGPHTTEDDVCVKYNTWKMDKAWSGQYTIRLYGALSSDEASILVQARTEHCGLDACLFRKKLQTVQRASAGWAMRQCYTCCCAANGTLTPARSCRKRQAIGRGVG